MRIGSAATTMQNIASWLSSYKRRKTSSDGTIGGGSWSGSTWTSCGRPAAASKITGVAREANTRTTVTTKKALPPLTTTTMTREKRTTPAVSPAMRAAPPLHQSRRMPEAPRSALRRLIGLQHQLTLRLTSQVIKAILSTTDIVVHPMFYSNTIDSN